VFSILIGKFKLILFFTIIFDLFKKLRYNVNQQDRKKQHPHLSSALAVANRLLLLSPIPKLYFPHKIAVTPLFCRILSRKD
jgi:hypothetical protein